MGKIINVQTEKHYFVNSIKKLLLGPKAGRNYPNGVEMSITDNMGLKTCYTGRGHEKFGYME